MVSVKRFCVISPLSQTLAPHRGSDPVHLRIDGTTVPPSTTPEGVAVDEPYVPRQFHADALGPPLFDTQGCRREWTVCALLEMGSLPVCALHLDPFSEVKVNPPLAE